MSVAGGIGRWGTGDFSAGRRTQIHNAQIKTMTSSYSVLKPTFCIFFDRLQILNTLTPARPELNERVNE